MHTDAITPARLAEQEARFAQAFATGNLELVRSLYHPHVVYLSPTVRLFGWPSRIEGVDRTLEFIALTIQHVTAVAYQAVEQAVLPDGHSAFVRIQFDWDRGPTRLRSNYVVLYRYRDGRIAQQELYYDPSGARDVIEQRQQ